MNVYGAKDLRISPNKNKNYVVTLRNGKKIHFGDSRYEDFLTHGDKERRERYRKKASKIRDKEGNLTFRSRNSPNVWSYHLGIS